MEALKITGFILLFAGTYALVNDIDYHDKFDKHITVRYNCEILIGGWHPDVPPQVIEECRKPNRREVVTYKDE
jgi:hypothetical protein